MGSYLVISVRFHDGRYHGAGEWPPSPARLFQALMAGAALSGPESLRVFRDALTWLERKEAPTIAAAPVIHGQRVTYWVPNNDDYPDGDPRLIGEVREKKIVHPVLFDQNIAQRYVWAIGTEPSDEEAASLIADLADRLFQFGRGVDMAWAWAEILNEDAVGALLQKHPGPILRPSGGTKGSPLSCPTHGSFESIAGRYAASGRRLSVGDFQGLSFSQAPRPRFQEVVYGSPPQRRVYEMREHGAGQGFAPWPLERASCVVTLVRDAAVERLSTALPKKTAIVRRCLVGRDSDGSPPCPVNQRVRIIPLPSVGHEHADQRIRRILVEVPGHCPLQAEDVFWAFSALPIGEPAEAVLVSAEDRGMLIHYGADAAEPHHRWRSVTPVALPMRHEPSRGTSRKTWASTARRGAWEVRGMRAVIDALRHAGVTARPTQIRLRREPFSAHGARAETFAAGTRFTTGRLRHVELEFSEPISGPLVLGDGRFLGLGVMAPVRNPGGVLGFRINEGLASQATSEDIARSLRAAVMARVRDTLGARRELPPFFSGHKMESSLPTRAPHLTFAHDAAATRLLVIAPHVMERRSPTGREIDHLHCLQKALRGFRILRAGQGGLLQLEPLGVLSEEDVLFHASRTWETGTPYVVTRHAKVGDTESAIRADILRELDRARLPRPETISLRQVRSRSGLGLSAHARLDFRAAVSGPLLLGRTRFLGGGFFHPPTPSNVPD